MATKSSLRIARLRSNVLSTARPRCPYPKSRVASIISSQPHRSYATEDNEDDKRTFRGQLYESTAARVAREREEQSRFAAMRKNRYEGDKGRSSSSLVANTGWAIVLAVSVALAYRYGSRSAPAPPTTSTIPLQNAVEPQHDTRETTLQSAWADMVEILGKENVSTDKDDRAAHAGSDWSSYHEKEKETPFMILRPATTEEVSQIMKVCHTRRIPVTPYSGGTSLEGHYAATRGGVCIDFSRMDKILTIHKDDLDVVVQPSVGWESLNEVLGEVGLFFPPDPGPGAMIGGMIGTGCSGTNAYRYGTMKEWVLSLTVVLADGTIIKTRQRPRKSSAGYDLTRTFIGSEGTLGLVTEAVLKVTTKPSTTSVAVSAFPSIKAAADCVFRVVGAGVPIAAIEILDDVQMKCINDADGSTRKWTEAPTLFFKFSGTPSAVKEHISIVQGLAKKSGSKTFEFAKGEEQQEELWSARKEALWSVMAKRNDGDRVWTTDVAVPISKLPDLIEITKQDMVDSGLLGSIVGHVGDGNFHSIILYNESKYDVAEGVVHRMVKRAIELEGTATGEHGVGLVKRDYLPHEVGDSTVDTMRKLKQAFDPLCLLNCDKIVRVSKPKPGEIQEW